MTQTAKFQNQLPDFELDRLNRRFEAAHPLEILSWCDKNISSGLVQTSAFNVDDMVITDILYQQIKLKQPIPVLFLETLHHFSETIAFVRKAQQVYDLNIKVYKIQDVDTRKAFATRYGEALWESDLEKFHQLTKVEPLERGLNELETVAWITGRRRNQAPGRTQMPIFELDRHGRVKINPLATWTRRDTWAYVAKHHLIYNPLHDQGYSSIGDQPLTTSVSGSEDERAGRWRGTDKTECGIHL